MIRKFSPAAVLIYVFFVFSAASGSGQSSGLAGTGSDSAGQNLAVSAWRWSADADESCISAEYDDSQWQQAESKKKIDIRSPMMPFWLRAHIARADYQRLLQDGASAGGLWFISDRGGLSYEAYVNGTYIGTRGSWKGQYDVRRSITEAYHIPASMLSEEQEIVITLRCRYDGSNPIIPKFLLGNRQYFEQNVARANFWNDRVYMMLSILCIFIGFYFLILFAASGRQKLENLFFGLSSLLLGIYFFEMGSDYIVGGGGPVFRALGRGSLSAAMLLFIPFFAVFFDYHYSRKLGVIVSAMAAAALIAFILIKDNENLMSSLFTIGLVFVLGAMVCAIMAAVHAVKRGSKDAIPPLIGIALGSFFAIHDVYYQVRGIDPFAWLQGFAIFIMDGSVFIALSMRQVSLTNEFERLGKTLSVRSRELENSLLKIGNASVQVSDIGHELGRSVESVTQAVERSSQKLIEVESESQKLAGKASEADSLVSDFIQSIGTVNEKLEAQSSDIALTASSTEALSANIEQASSHIERTAAFAADLAKLTSEGEAAAQSLSKMMAKVSESTKGIIAIADAVNEFAEQTNLLAMNAAIEAAHVGAAGKGFAVIAGEVKGLAASQSDRAAKISKLVEEINKGTEEGGAAAVQLTASLRSIAEGARTAADSMAQVKNSSLEESAAGAKLRDSMKSISEAALGIGSESRRQNEYSAKVREAVGLMTSSAEDSRASAEAIARESGEISHEVEQLRILVSKSIKLTEELNALRNGAGNAGPAQNAGPAK